MPPAAIIAGGVGLGALAGAMPKTSSSNEVSKVDAGTATGLEVQGSTNASNALSDLTSFSNAGPGGKDVAQGYGAQNDLAAMLRQYAQGGGLPTAQDFGTARDISGQVFQGQQTALNQQFQQQQIQAQRLAAQMNRPVNDPVLQAKLAQQQGLQQQQLSADQGAYGAQLAMQLPGQRLGYMNDFANLRANLASQAMSNRQTLLSLGSQLQAQGQNYRLQTATRTSNGQQSSGGGLGGAISGAISGAGAGLSMAGGLASLSGGAAGASNLGGIGAGGAPGNMASASAMNFGSSPYFNIAQGAAGYGFGSPGGGGSSPMAPSLLSRPAPSSTSYFGGSAQPWGYGR